jgi:uncharacterized protein YodC (DUF2158 family)
MANLKIGDVVWLKSGSPSMTVRYIDKDDIITCDWFDGNKNDQSRYHSDQLIDKNPSPRIMPKRG